MSFSTVLVANRGEIACRVLRSAQRLGYRTVAVFSDADAHAPHVALAERALRIGAAPALDSYLNIAAVLDAARRSGADALHPGYGFLSERADFAQAMLDAGLVFIGPPPAAMHAMADKANAKRRMLAAGVPCAPGYLGDEQSDERFASEAARLGLPLLVKALAGGGGRGMRLVRQMSELLPALAAARREAQSAFGDERLMLETLIEGGRHIEVQVFADQHGHTLHLGERDCSTQRRRQKVVEEAPSPAVDGALRERMGRHAVAAAQAVGYCGAGTVEFIVDAEGRHYFLEMNTRLQVEHTVTECITGLDLVEWQLRIAAGEPLPLTQAQVQFSGHAVQARLYAEDPAADWAPQSGRVSHWRPADAGIRVDHGISEGDEITPYYDAMVAKFIAHGSNRADALRRLTRALEQAPLLGPKNNGGFLHALLQHPQFVGATLTTNTLDDWVAAGEPLLQRALPDENAWRLAAALRAAPAGGAGRQGRSAQRPASVAQFDLTLECAGVQRTQRAPPAGVQLLGAQRASIDGVLCHFIAATQGARLQLALAGQVFEFTEPSPYPAAQAGLDAGRACAPVAGIVAQIKVALGDVVAAGQPLVCVEAMKMEMWVSAGAAGTVRALPVQARDAVAAGALLVELEIHA